MRRQIIILGCLLSAAVAHGQILRPPIDDSIWCQMWPDTCTTLPVERRAPARPPYDPWLADYSLPQTIGVMQGFHDSGAKNILSHTTNEDFVWEARSHGFRVMKIWMDVHPLDGLGEPFCHGGVCDTDTLAWDPESCTHVLGHSLEDMVRFWGTAPFDVVFVRLHRWVQEESGCMIRTKPPYYEITRRLYELIGWRDVTVVFTDWEEDWHAWGCPSQETYTFPFEHGSPYYGSDCIEQCMEPSLPEDLSEVQDFIDSCVEDSTIEECSEQTLTSFGVMRTVEDCTVECGLQLVEQRYRDTIAEIERRQAEVELARKEAYIERGHRPNLRVMTAAIVNLYPQNKRPYQEGTRTLAERIDGVERRPDLIGASYWLKSVDPVEVLQWLSDTTGYPPSRIYIDEFGAAQDKQAERFASYIPAFWKFGIKTVNLWMWRQPWCDNNLGLWKQLQPCSGRVAWGDPTDGYYVARELNGG